MALEIQRAAVEAEFDAEHLLEALDDNGDGAEDEGLFAKLAAQAAAEVEARAALVALAHPAPPQALLERAAVACLCAMLFRRRGVADEQNPFAEREQAAFATLDKLASGELNAGAIALAIVPHTGGHTFLEDARTVPVPAGGGYDGFAAMKEEMENGEGMDTARNLNTTIKRVNAIWEALKKATDAAAPHVLALLLAAGIATARADGIVPETLGEMSPDAALYTAPQTDELLDGCATAEDLAEVRSATETNAAAIAAHAVAANPHGITAAGIGALTAETDSVALAALETARDALQSAISANAGDIHSNAAALTGLTNALGQRISEFETVHLVYNPSTATADTYYVPTNCPTRNLAIHLLVTVYTSTNQPCYVRIPANWNPGRPMTVTLYGSGHTNTRISYGIGNTQHMVMTGPNARECEYVWLPEAEQWEIHYRNVANGFDNPNAAGVKVTGAGRLANMPTTIEDWIAWRQQQPW